MPGERNDKLHRLASHLRYIADNDEALMADTLRLLGQVVLDAEDDAGGD